nr:MAG: hypothetical protein AM324_10125 [Candidatus Thorarchaeota archaeon SMTZ1-83]
MAWPETNIDRHVKSEALPDAPAVIWEHTYGGPYWDWCHDMIEVSSGGYAITGFTDAPWASQGGVMWLVRTASNGDMVWNSTYSGNLPLNGTYTVERTSALALIECDSGGFALAGYATVVNPDTEARRGEMWLVRTDADGNHLWNRTYGEGGLHDLVECSDGGFTLFGLTERSGGAGRDDLYLAHTDADGNLLWEYMYGGSECDFSRHMVQCSDGGYAMLATSYSYGLDFQILLVRTDSEGSLLWVQTYGGPDYDSGDCFLALDDGFLIVGHAENEGLRIIRTDADGDMIWMRRFLDYVAWRRSAATGFGESVVQCNNGGFAIAGYGVNPLGQGGGWLLRIDDNGNILWSQHHPRTDRDEIYAIVENSEGGFVMAGQTEVDWEAGDFDFWLLRVADQAQVSGYSVIAGAVGVSFALLVGVFALRRREKWPDL